MAGVMRQVRQHMLPVWMLRGFARGTGEASETIWAYTKHSVLASRLKDAGAVPSQDPDPVPAGLVRVLDAAMVSQIRTLKALNRRPAGPLAGPNDLAVDLIIWLAIRVFYVFAFMDRALFDKILSYLDAMQRIPDKPEALQALISAADFAAKRDPGAAYPASDEPMFNTCDPRVLKRQFKRLVKGRYWIVDRPAGRVIVGGTGVPRIHPPGVGLDP